MAMSFSSPSASPKRVLLMVSSMRGGGSERQVLLLAKSLDRSKFTPHLYLTEAAGEFLDQVPSDVPIHSFDAGGPTGGVYIPGRQLRRQTQWVQKIIAEQAIDVVYDRTFHMTLISGKALPGVRRVSTIVSPPHLALPSVERRFVESKRRRLAEAYRKSNVVVAVSKQAATSAETYYGLAAGSVVVVKNPVDRERLVDAAGPPPAKDLRHTRLVCVGRMTIEKGHADLLGALAALKDRWPDSRPPWVMRFVGDGPLRSDLESRVRTLGLESRVQFLGALKEAAPEIAAADALVLPSRFEGLPNAVLESMALGIPVIATRAGGTVELEQEEPTVFWAEPQAPETLAEAMLDFARHPENAAAHREAAQKLIRREHDLRTTMAKIEDLLDG